jgi:hypothetical protein
MPSEPPTLIAIDHDDYHADRVGTTKDGTQFFVTTPFIPEQVKQVADWFLTRDFADILDLAELGTLPADVAVELAQAVRRRSERK